MTKPTLHCATELGGEVGEALNEVKKDETLEETHNDNN